MTKSEVKAALNEAIIAYNKEMEEYIVQCDEQVRNDYRQIVSSTMGCFEAFRDIIAELAD